MEGSDAENRVVRSVGFRVLIVLDESSIILGDVFNAIVRVLICFSFPRLCGVVLGVAGRI